MKECPVCQSCFPDTVKSCNQDGQPTKLTLSVETVIQGRYRLEKRRGHGSVSIVYIAYDLVLGTTRAVKIILPDLIGSDAGIGERFLHDATATSAIHHPNIVAVTDSGMLNKVVPFIVMEFVSGPSLQDTLSISGALTPSEAFEYVSTIGSGLAAAHKLGIVHGDLKPRNILMEKDRTLVEAIKIADFGLSKIKSGKLYGPLAMPKATGMLRSPLYLAPEEWSDGESDNRSDIYSLGIILYQMLAGDVPFKGRSIPAIMKQHLMNPPPSIAGPSGRISIELEAVVLHALRKDPAERPSTVEHFVEELRSAVKGAGAPKSVNEPPQIDLDQTIVISKKRVDCDELMPVGGKGEFGADELAHHKPVVTEPGESDFDMTIVPGMIGYPPPERSSEPSESSGELRLNIDNDEQLSRDPAAVSITDGLQHSAFAIPADEAEELPRSIPPILLAAGVILVVLLIGVGVYYSHMSQ